MITNLENEDALISEFLKSIGPWSDSIVIGGGYAPIIYKLYFDRQASGIPPIGTRDIDSLISRKIHKSSRKNLSQYLEESGFRKQYKDYDYPATETYIKEIQGVDVEIEFLTDDATRSDKNKNVVIAGIVAQPLSYLSLSLKMKLEFSTNSSLIGYVVTPGTWIFHKGLTFLRRNNTFKILKDLYGIWYVATQLDNFSEQAIEELKILKTSHNSWFRTYQGNLKHWLEDATPSDWTKLESQDPFGFLKRSNFARTVSKLILE